MKVPRRKETRAGLAKAAAKMRVRKRLNRYWILNVPDTVSSCGPYDTRDEAEDSLRGLVRFFTVEYPRTMKLR